MAKVGILGSNLGLSMSIIQKLVRSDYAIYTSKQTIRLLEDTDKTLLDYCLNPPKTIEDDIDYLFQIGDVSAELIPSRVGRTILISNYDTRGTNDAECNIFIKDMIPSNATDEMGSLGLIRLLSDEQIPAPDAENWWVGEVDVVEAICSLVKNPGVIDGASEIMISGRRSWKFKDIHAEMKLLHARTLDGRSGIFNAKNLVNPTPNSIVLEELQTGVIKVESLPNLTDVSVKQVTQPVKPDLAILHNTLKKINGEGWRQTQPIRQALMIYLASLLESHNV